MKEQLVKVFKEKFGSEGDIRSYFAPGRVNLIGEHTDYNGGHVFPCALTIGTYAIVRKREDRNFRFYSTNFESLGVIEASLDNLKYDKALDWTNYPLGVVWAFIEKGYPVDCGFDMLLFGNIPNGSGLSSSASVEVVTGVALRDLFGYDDISMIDIALFGQYSENNFNGVNCGIMDQFASVFGKAGNLIRLDCSTMEYEYIPFDPQGYKLVLIDSVTKHELVDSPYNKRRQSCERAAAAIAGNHPEVKLLGDATLEMLEEVKDKISEEDYMRATYAIQENSRLADTCEALKRGDYETVGKNIYATHHGMSKLYEVSTEELDFLNDVAKECGVTGSRIMGGGFGGCTIHLVKDAYYDRFIETAISRFKTKFGKEPKVYPVTISDGARKLN